ncbi:Protein CBG07579 [Caenorhabditis briggsae]|uniref:DUF7758 domain-containing protein n=3 Tax=Caenorhabditis briggsae TaxID=6238 RepID=A0AAE8ZWP8_CAEBR|nr:Protein CBG07579 [Caenorhabditis briggsae]ULT84634.1 hypothetical protein L3Y34_013350 [Caenorhabditis briggsae]UMM43877.1 hypothetical protein L5515_019194 [Caenorhabditis briggsae]CAP27545.1 Protein CBG07579 [Caenorhabditis briggsae]
MDRTQAFEKAKSLAEAGTLDEAFEAIEKYTSEDGIEYTLPEMQIINIIVCEKLTSCSFEEKKDACFQCLPLLEGVKMVKSAEWLELYIDAVYDVFSKLSRYARDEERNEVWNRIKEIYYELTLAAKKVWKEKNAPGGLEVYVSYAKLVKSYLDVADEDSFKICETYAKEAKFVGKGTLEDEDFRDAKKSIDTINKMITDAKHEKELIQDSD